MENLNLSPFNAAPAFVSTLQQETTPEQKTVVATKVHIEDESQACGNASNSQSVDMDTVTGRSGCWTVQRAGIDEEKTNERKLRSMLREEQEDESCYNGARAEMRVGQQQLENRRLCMRQAEINICFCFNSVSKVVVKRSIEFISEVEFSAGQLSGTKTQPESTLTHEICAPMIFSASVVSHWIEQ